MVTLLIVLFTTIFGSIFLKSFINCIGIVTEEPEYPISYSANFMWI